MSLTLTRRIPARTKTATFLWCKKDFTKMDPGYRAIRATTSDPMDQCFWCNHKFKDGEMMALANFGTKGNKMLCQGCAGELVESEEPPKNA